MVSMAKTNRRRARPAEERPPQVYVVVLVAEFAAAGDDVGETMEVALTCDSSTTA